MSAHQSDSVKSSSVSESYRAVAFADGRGFTGAALLLDLPIRASLALCLASLSTNFQHKFR